jgi:CDP-diglyceride synthetase
MRAFRQEMPQAQLSISEALIRWLVDESQGFLPLVLRRRGLDAAGADDVNVCNLPIDVGALLFGLAFGKHKMSPTISPKKTWEGAVGGVLTSAGVGSGLAALLAAYFPPGLTPLMGALIAVPVAILAIVSDLVESVIKRRARTKDAGATIPGIGGMFDLSDSLILTAPLGYLAFSWLSS